MEAADKVEWLGDARDRFIERAIELESWGDYEGLPNLGRRLISEVDNKIKEIQLNMNLYAVRDDDERVVNLPDSNHILIYKKVSVLGKMRLQILDVRRFY